MKKVNCIGYFSVIKISGQVRDVSFFDEYVDVILHGAKSISSLMRDESISFDDRYVVYCYRFSLKRFNKSEIIKYFYRNKAFSVKNKKSYLHLFKTFSLNEERAKSSIEFIRESSI